MACHCDLPVRITHKKRGWSHDEWSTDDICGNCGEIFTPLSGRGHAKKLTRKERSARAKARYSGYRSWIKDWITQRGYQKESHYYILGCKIGTSFKVLEAIKPSWTNLGTKVRLTKGVVYLAVEDPNDDWLSKASVCLYAPRGDDHPEVEYYRVQPEEVRALKF